MATSSGSGVAIDDSGGERLGARDERGDLSCSASSCSLGDGEAPPFVFAASEGANDVWRLFRSKDDCRDVAVVLGSEYPLSLDLDSLSTALGFGFSETKSSVSYRLLRRLLLAA